MQKNFKFFIENNLIYKIKKIIKRKMKKRINCKSRLMKKRDFSKNLKKLCKIINLS